MAKRAATKKSRPPARAKRVVKKKSPPKARTKRATIRKSPVWAERMSKRRGPIPTPRRVDPRKATLILFLTATPDNIRFWRHGQPSENPVGEEIRLDVMNPTPVPIVVTGVDIDVPNENVSIVSTTCLPLGGDPRKGAGAPAFKIMQPGDHCMIVVRCDSWQALPFADGASLNVWSGQLNVLSVPVDVGP